MALVQVAQRAQDLARATEWYSQLLGTEPTASFDPPGLVFFDLDGVRLLIDRVAPSALHYFGVSDGRKLEAARADVLALEQRVLKALAADPTGARPRQAGAPARGGTS